MKKRLTKEELVEQNKILVIKTGSHLYGTNTPESDEDYVGIFMPPEEYVYGFDRMDEVDLSVVSKTEDNKNTKDAVDMKYYDFRKFIKLAMENNPNIIELLSVNPENIVFINDIGKELLNKARMFPHQGCKDKFKGYAHAQKHKMFIKRDNYNAFNDAKMFLANFSNKVGSYPLYQIVPERYHEEEIFKEQFNSKSGKLDFYKVGDINLLPQLSVKNALKAINERLDKVGNREELYLKHMFDVKFAAHLIRLYVEGYQLYTQGYIQFPLEPYIKDELLSIRRGEYKIEEVLELAGKLEKLFDHAIEKKDTPLPHKARHSEIEEFMIRTIKEFLNGSR